MMKTYTFFSLFMCISLLSGAQNRYFVYLKDKANSEYSVSRPQEFLGDRSISRRKNQGIEVTTRDLPPNKSYIRQIKNLGVNVVYASRWMNALLIETTPNKLNSVKNLSFVKGIEGNGDIRGVSDATGAYPLQEKEAVIDGQFEYGYAKVQVEMLGVNKMHQKGFTGKGVLIGVLDSGFRNANTLSFLNDLFQQNRVVNTYDFVSNEKSVYEDDPHGTSVLSCMAAAEQGKMIGTAPDASYVLLRTEDVNSETRIEEVYWLLGAEYSDSLGVDIINSSLGYNLYDNSSQNYTYQDMNGDKTIAARAADWAAASGILVVVSAGNEGNKSWKYIGTPADADSVIAVGAVDANSGYASFSSLGPGAKGNVKPELSARGSGTTVGTYFNTISTSNGTSFSSPLMAGMAAGLRQAFPQLTAMELRDLMIRSGHQYSRPDNYLGYGIPDFDRASNLAQKAARLAIIEREVKNSGKEIVVFPNPISDFSGLSVYINKELDQKTNLNVSLFDNKGVLLWSEERSSKFFSLPAELSTLPSGTYQLKVFNDTVNLSSKVVKE